MRTLFLLILLITNYLAISQIPPVINSKILVGKDSTLYLTYSTNYYSYFEQEYDSSLFTVFEDSFQLIKVVENNTKDGYYKVLLEGSVLYYYNICNNEINGTGFTWYYEGKGKPLYLYGQSSFKKNLLHGITIIYSKNKSVKSIYLFKKGKCKKILYDISANTKKGLKEMNKNVVSPFIWQ